MARVLLVEDEPWLGELYQTLLLRAGHDLRWCRDGYDAIDTVDTFQPELIVLDFLLPWGNGLQLLHELASHADLATTPVILCSNVLPHTVTAEVLRQYGVVAVIDKANTTPKKFISSVNRAFAYADLPY